MDNALKQRVLGVIVLFALIGICITVLLHNNKVAQQQGLQHARQIIASSQKTTPIQQTLRTQTNTPTPTVAPAPVAVISQPQASAPTTNSVFNNDNAIESTPVPSTQIVEAAPISPISHKKTKSIIQTASTPTETTTITTTNTTTTTPAATFSVRVGTFSKRENAVALVKALHERGFSTATTQAIKTKHGDMTRVVIGGNGLTRKEAETIKLHLSKNLHLTGVVAPLGKTKTTSHVSAHATHSNTKTTTKKTETKTHTPATTTNNTTSDDSGAVVIP